MGKIYYTITPEFQDFIKAQPMFFVATAPCNTQSLINISPKGLDCFRIITPNQVAYLDLVGSGNETASHLQENGRITIMFCSFGPEALILRLYGNGWTVLPDSQGWSELKSQFPDYPGSRQIIVANIFKVQSSCGGGVPVMDFVRQREATTA